MNLKSDAYWYRIKRSRLPVSYVGGRWYLWGHPHRRLVSGCLEPYTSKIEMASKWPYADESSADIWIRALLLDVGTNLWGWVNNYRAAIVPSLFIQQAPGQRTTDRFLRRAAFLSMIQTPDTHPYKWTLNKTRPAWLRQWKVDQRMCSKSAVPHDAMSGTGLPQSVIDLLTCCNETQS